MTMNKSFIENVELDSSGFEAYIQASGSGKDISLSFDGNCTSYGITLTRSEAKEYVEKLQKLLEESEDAN